MTQNRDYPIFGISELTLVCQNTLEFTTPIQMIGLKMKLKVKKLVPDAVLPSYATDGSNGLDFTATGVVYREDIIEVRTGIAVEIPEGHVGLLFPRSSITKKNFVLANSVGVIDSDYRGEINFNFRIVPESNAAGMFKYNKAYKQGERVGQLVIVEIPKMEVVEVKDLSDTVRGTGGYGSTGV